jgi:F0F1-type ATP synthase delta subunit
MKKADNFNVHEWNHKQKLANIITESQLNEEEQTTLEDILNKKGNLDHIKNNNQIRLKLIDGEFLRKNPEWKNQLVKFLFYDARQKLVGIELIGKGIYGNAYPKELVIDTQSTNAM